MPPRRRRLLVIAAGLLGLTFGIAGFAIYWSQFGPGLDREADRLAAMVELRPGMTVAEIGAGKGRLALRFGARVGRLYVTEMDPRNLKVLRGLAAERGLKNVVVIPAGEHTTGLLDGCCDVIYMRRTYHHFTDKDSMNKSLFAALRGGGRLAVVDFLSPRWLCFLRHGVAREAVLGEIISAGFVLERRVDEWSPIDYCLVFRKPASIGKPPVH
jgi:ubiquinone/menaquinone biosynthesis C-methylase UbiE